MRTPRTDGSAVSESASAIGLLTEEKGGRMSSTGGERYDDEGRDIDHLIDQFRTGNQKHYIENISRTEDAIVGRKE
jgi:uridine kinase